MRRRFAHTIIVATAVLAVFVSVLAFPFVKAQAAEHVVEMSMDMPSMDMPSMGTGDASAMPCMHGTKTLPCCPGSCDEMPACVTGCFIVAEVASDMIGAPLAHAPVTYESASEHSRSDRSVEPISRPPIP